MRRCRPRKGVLPAPQHPAKHQIPHFTPFYTPNIPPTHFLHHFPPFHDISRPSKKIETFRVFRPHRPPRPSNTPHTDLPKPTPQHPATHQILHFTPFYTPNNPPTHVLHHFSSFHDISRPSKKSTFSTPPPAPPHQHPSYSPPQIRTPTPRNAPQITFYTVLHPKHPSHTLFTPFPIIS